MLLGVRAVIAEIYERIHRSNLLMMGILPLQFLAGESRESLGLTGREEFSITGVENGEATEVTVRADGARVPRAACASTRRASASTCATAGSSRSSCGELLAPDPARAGQASRSSAHRGAADARLRSHPSNLIRVMPAKGEPYDRNDTPTWGIEPVPERLRVLGTFDGFLLWANLSRLAARDRRGRVPRPPASVRARAVAARGARARSSPRRWSAT